MYSMRRDHRYRGTQATERPGTIRAYLSRVPEQKGLHPDQQEPQPRRLVPVCPVRFGADKSQFQGVRAVPVSVAALVGEKEQPAAT